MKTTFTLLFCLLFLSTQAQNGWQWAKSVPHMGQTSEMRGIATDKEGNSVVVGQMREPFSGFKQGIAIAKYDPSGTRIWTYNIPGAYYNGAKFMDAVCDDDQNVYAVIVYNSTKLVVEGDSVSESDMALLKLDKDGKLQFIKATGSSGADELVGLSIQGGDLIIRAFGLASFDRESVSYTIPLWGRPYFMAYNLSGDLLTSSIASTNYNSDFMLLEKNNSDYFSYVTTTTVTKFQINTSTHTPSVSKTLDLVNQNGGYELKVMDVKSTDNGRIYAAGFFKSKYVLLEGDTLHNINNGYPTCFLLELDKDLKVLNHVLYYDVWGIQRQVEIQKLTVFKDEKVAVMNFFASRLFFPNDSLVAANNQWCASVVELNLDLSVKTMNQVNVNDEGGWRSWDFNYDGLGNLFCLFTHEEDMYFDKTLIKSANKSWSHLSALGKLGTGQSVSVETIQNKNKLQVYPNPSAGKLNILSDKAIKAITLYDLSGKVIKRESSASALDISGFRAGIYLLQVESMDGDKTTTRIIKTNH